MDENAPTVDPTGVSFFSRKEWNLIVDDIITPRSSKQVPFGAYHHEHGGQPNRPRFLWGQQMVALGLSLSYGKIWACLPLVLRVHKRVGNQSKVTTAVFLIRWLAPEFRQCGTQKLQVLVDAWFMKSPFILPLVNLGIDVTGQVRKDAALYDFPVSQKRGRGRPRKYGQGGHFRIAKNNCGCNRPICESMVTNLKE